MSGVLIFSFPTPTFNTVLTEMVYEVTRRKRIWEILEPTVTYQQSHGKCEV
jgi:hypothetical protein